MPGKRAAGHHVGMSDRVSGHGGDLVAEALKVWGVDRLFTLTGGHIFPVYDGAKRRNIRIVDTRHEQSAGFAAEGHAKLSRSVGVCALTAGPGVTNGISALASGFFNGSPMLMIGGRAPEGRWGSGSLQEIDHLPLVQSITKHAETVLDTALAAKATTQALVAACWPHRGPAFLDFPMDVLFNLAEIDKPEKKVFTLVAKHSSDPAKVVVALEASERPVILAGSDVWMNGAEGDLRTLAEGARIPVFMNGMGRGALPADHEMAFSAARGHAFSKADLVIVAGCRLDFRLNFGVFGSAKVVHLVDRVTEIAGHVPLEVGLATNALGLVFQALAGAAARDRESWISELRAVETEKRRGLEDELGRDSTPIHPARIYRDLVPRLARDGVVICDGGDFVSYAGKYVEVYEPGGWLDPGPFGCLGAGPGYALAAGLLEPERQIVLLLGDGAAGFGMGDWDTLVRFGINVTIVCGNNGVWGLEKHPMKFLYGYDVAADLRPETRYDEVMRGLGGHGELVREPDELGPALDRALSTPGPSLVNVLTDPAVIYPRGANLF